MATRRSAREALAALFAAQGFTTVNDYAPVEMAGATKVLNIYTWSSSLDRMSRDLKNNFHTFNLDVFVLREGGASEDDLDALHEAVVSVCLANPTNANWSHLSLEGESEARFTKVSGKQYRIERHRVRVKITN